MMYFVKVYVAYKDSVLDPQEEAVKKAVHRMRCKTIEDIHIEKYSEIQLANTEEPTDTMIETICDKLLASVNMETYRYEIKKIEGV